MRILQVTWLETDLFTLGLGFLMLSMGLTLKFEDFRRCLRNPWTVGVGFLAQYFIKPLLGFTIAMVFLVLPHCIIYFVYGSFKAYLYAKFLLNVVHFHSNLLRLLQNLQHETSELRSA